ncbi:glycerol-3-phosphate dehydrogenase [Janthinobacterium lividum]|uniref:Glycerol-3-phosphate dehydrogenase n=1 Tax=Janthinobacterium lividum TaxID=29581 RepID=A0ABU0XTG7_9BURK|nr:glycerol-3-phosphate dehydrogenase [Janthinobacterium lividum]MDQ4625496.1 glycerol-3-phosphate dehydrogenase [Janthinobacterium lividum]MDQ4672901.1 glycerol-3-phosphate dehydrogenase [Janthinobacterium lividum]MDQ4683629.1 glycerol-3-phosphate dehydrogenase [Janthinobacterium lividum]
MTAAQQGVETAMACDVLVVGGGINGAGIARDAAGRGLSVVLCEKDDLAAHTSSASTKLIHGGLRYLEYYEFGLVRKALIEREVLLRSAPHIMWPLRFVMPHAQGQRPAWLIRAGLFLYDMLAKREILPGSSGIDLTRHAAGKPLKPEFKRGFVYSDGWVDDARLVVLNAIDAADNGAHVLTQTRCTALWRDGAGADASWQATLLRGDGRELSVRARSVVNAAGPWTAEFLQQAAPGGQGRHLRLIKGSHIVVKRLFEHDHAYIFQHPDGRIVFAIPYEHDFTLIGTTDLDYHGDSGKVEIDDEEIRYLCELSSYYFSKPIVPADVVWTYAGVRPLVEDAAADAKAVTRDYRFELDQEGAPLLSVFGGKITTFRKLAEEALDVLEPLLVPEPGKRRRAWTEQACLPGGDVYGAVPQNRSVREFGHFVQGLQREYAWLPAALVARYARAYGTRIHVLLEGRADVAAMGEEVAAGLYAAEVDYLRRHEWAVSAADILWRRSKLGLHLPRGTADRLDAWLLQHPLP